VKKLQFLHESTTCLHWKTKTYIIVTSLYDNNTQVNQNCNYSASNRVGNSNTKVCHFVGPHGIA